MGKRTGAGLEPRQTAQVQTRARRTWVASSSLASGNLLAVRNRFDPLRAASERELVRHNGVADCLWPAAWSVPAPGAIGARVVQRGRGGASVEKRRRSGPAWRPRKVLPGVPLLSITAKRFYPWSSGSGAAGVEAEFTLPFWLSAVACMPSLVKRPSDCSEGNESTVAGNKSTKTCNFPGAAPGSNPNSEISPPGPTSRLPVSIHPQFGTSARPSEGSLLRVRPHPAWPPASFPWHQARVDSASRCCARN